MAVTDPLSVIDLVTAELVECAPEPEGAVLAVSVIAAPEISPAQAKQAATIEHTGADPPPRDS